MPTLMLVRLVRCWQQPGYVLTSSPGNQSAAPFGEMLGFALAFIGAFVAHIVIWRSYPGGTWWSPT